MMVSSSGTAGRKDYDINRGVFVAVNKLMDKHEILQFAKDGYGDQTTQELINASDIVVCMDPTVRKDCLSYNMPQATLVWDIDDMDEYTHTLVSHKGHSDFLDEAYELITNKVNGLVNTINF